MITKECANVQICKFANALPAYAKVPEGEEAKDLVALISLA
jgi:hypothetical protein